MHSMNPYFQPIPLGLSLPLKNPHAVSVSLPTMQDVIGYEENVVAVKSLMVSGYPRFFQNKLVERLTSFVRKENNVQDSFELLPIMSNAALKIIKRKFSDDFRHIEKSDAVFLCMEKDHVQLPAVKEFIRHTGMLLPSRKAEDILFSSTLILEKYPEQLSESNDAGHEIKSVLCSAYNAASAEEIFLCSCGMNAFYAVFDAIIRLYKNTGRQTMVQAGWLYLDSFEIIRKYSRSNILISSAADMGKLEEQIMQRHEEIAAVFTEVPNNPLLECIDLPALYKLCKKYHLPLIVDTSIGTPFNLNILPYCDIAVESLTKFASGKADVMMGAVIFNHESRIAQQIKEHALQGIVMPYYRDELRLAKTIEAYESRVLEISHNTKTIIAYLEKSPAVKELYTVLHPKSNLNFQKIQKHQDALPGLISVVFDNDLAHYYDKLNIPKGPSLGTEFTLAMPYIYLAHYDMVKTPVGRETLHQMGINPELLRISVGTEPSGEIISALKSAGI